MKQGILTLFTAILLISMQGCAWTVPSPTPQSNTTNLSGESYETKNPKLSHLVGKNYIKGLVTAVNHENAGQTWNYVIEGIDTANGKLPYVNFNHKAVVANEGDLVYGSFDGNKLTEMLIIKAGYYKNGKPQPVVLKKSTSGDKSSGKRDKAHQVLSVPQEEIIRF